VAALALQWGASQAPDVVESLYSRGLYPRIAALLALVDRRVPFSIAEPLALALLVVFAASLIGGPWSARLRRSVTAAGVVYLLFLLGGGLNYQRRPFAESAGLDTRPSTAAELEEVTAALLSEAAALRQGLPEDASGAARLQGGPRAALDRLCAGFSEVAGAHPSLEGPCPRPKLAWSSTVMSYLGISGIFIPFTGEPHVNATLPEFELPFTAAHEIAHQKGFLREDEANYVASLACRLHPDRDLRYSGALMATLEAGAALAQVDREAWRRLTSQLTPAERRDLAAMERWSRRYRGPLMAVSHRVNDAYLKSQGQREGVRTYGRMVDLLLAEARAGGPRSVARLDRNGARR
jgi:hypothetical protein